MNRARDEGRSLFVTYSIEFEVPRGSTTPLRITPIGSPVGSTEVHLKVETTPLANLDFGIVTVAEWDRFPATKALKAWRRTPTVMAWETIDSYEPLLLIASNSNPYPVRVSGKVGVSAIGW